MEPTGWSLNVSDATFSPVPEDSGGAIVVDKSTSGYSPVLPAEKRPRAEIMNALASIVVGGDEISVDSDVPAGNEIVDISSIKEEWCDTSDPEAERLAQEEYNQALEAETVALALVAHRRVISARTRLENVKSRSSRSNKSRSRFRESPKQQKAENDPRGDISIASDDTAVTGLRGLRDDLSSIVANSIDRMDREEAFNEANLRAHQDELRTREISEQERNVAERAAQVEMARQRVAEHVASIRQRVFVDEMEKARINRTGRNCKSCRHGCRLSSPESPLG